MEKTEIVRKYVEKLINSPINLTAYKDFDEALAFLYIDSVLPVKSEDLGELFLDIGTGGGVPGVFLSVEFDKKCLLVDSICKKVHFIQQTCKELGIDKVEAMCSRAEELKEKGVFFEKFDSAVSRAVARIATVLELTTPYVKVGGKVLLYKGPGYSEELGQSVNAMKELGVKLCEVRKYSIRSKDRFLLVFEKISQTPDRYPRRVGIPEKRPIR